MKAVRLFTTIVYFLTAMLFAPKLLGQVGATNGGTPMKVVGCFPRWGIYSNYFVKNIVTSGSAPLLTHLAYAFANVVNNRCVSFDSWADYQAPVTAGHAVNGQAAIQRALAGNFHHLQALNNLYPPLTTIL